MPGDPERLKVINRVVTVLQAITAGDTYFFTPYDVEKFRRVREQVNLPEAKPHYEVVANPGDVELGGTDLSDEGMIISVFGMIEHSTDLVGAAEKCREDVINAINADIKSGTAGSLGTLADWPKAYDSAPVFNYVEGQNWAIFRQDFRCLILINT